MSLFDALSGRIGHFNSIAVPAYNNISRKIANNLEGIEERFFGLSLGLIASNGVDLFFKPGIGPAIKDIKEYNQHDFEKLYAVFIIWTFYDLCGFFKSSQKDTLKNKLKNILDLNDNEFDYYYEKLEHKMEFPTGLNKLWEEVIKIIHTMPKTEENYLVFSREFSGICREAYQKLEQ